MNSPLCENARGELPAGALRDCRVSGFEGGRAPSGDYGLDVHINTDVAHLGNEVAALFEDIIQFGWTVLVAIVRGVMVLVDWCYTIDLLSSPAMSGVAQALGQVQSTFTQPLLALVLAFAAMGALYHGLIRRRVAQTLGEALVMIAMMAGGLWVIASPTGTVGALGAWANEASLGTLAAATGRSPNRPERTLAESDREMFGVAIDTPWCFMEFGSVGWCDAAVEPRLRAAALKLAALGRATERAVARSDEGSGPPRKVLEWEIRGSEEGQAPGVSRQDAALLAQARTNGELFLALPANGPARNSIGETLSLFRALCGSSEEPCRGPTAGEAEFRTQSGVWWRAIGLTMIAGGLLGMVLLLGFIAWRLLHAAFMSLVYLLLTPAAVLAPALGESGRAAFRTWAMRLLGAVGSKLIYSFLLGAVLMVQRGLLAAHLFGWFIQWLMLSSLWWIAYLRRHHLFDLARGSAGAAGGAGAARERRSIVRRVSGALESRKGMTAARWVKRRLSQPGPRVERRLRAAQVRLQRGEQAKAGMHEQVTRALEHEHRHASAIAEHAPRIQERLAAKRAQLGRVQAKRDEALASRDTRRAIELQDRGQRIAGEIAKEQRSLSSASRTARDGRQIQDMTGNVFSREQARRRERFLDTQAALPSTVQRRVHGAQGSERDYAGLASVLGHSRERFEQLDHSGKRAMRLKIDRELESRQALAGIVADSMPVDRNGSNGHEQRAADMAPDRWPGLGSGSRPGSRSGPRPPVKGRRELGPDGVSDLGGRRRDGATPVDAHARRRRSTVLDDARAVRARQKRQLGSDRP